MMLNLLSTKTIGFLLGSLLFLSCTSDDKKPTEEPILPKDREAIIREAAIYFSRILSGSEETYNDDTVLGAEEITEERDLVWQAWKFANENHSEEKLIDLGSLDEKNSGRWEIPASLEPDAVMPYYWGAKGAKPAGGYPLFLYLHGSGNKTTEWETGYQLALDFEDAPSVYFIPQIPNTGDYYRWFLRSKQWVWEKLLRQAFLTDDIDPNKVYFFGISEGGYGSQRLASFYADYLAGAGPMAGGEPLVNAPVENCRNTAFFLRTGAQDGGFYRNTLTQYTKDEFEKFETANPGYFTHNIELIPGAGHSIDYSQTTPWLAVHTRNPYPKSVSWENYEMDGRYRSGFHNIAVEERSNDDSSTRTFYELNIDGNNISLTARLATYQTTEVDPVYGIEMKFAKSYSPVTKGKVTIYLCDELVDLGREITLEVNGREVFKGEVKPERRHLVKSCAIFFDPARLYPAAIEVDFSKL